MTIPPLNPAFLEMLKKMSSSGQPAEIFTTKEEAERIIEEKYQWVEFSPSEPFDLLAPDKESKK